MSTCNARPKLARFLQEYEIAVVPFGAAHWDEATEALRFGKGRHPAALDYGTDLVLVPPA